MANRRKAGSAYQPERYNRRTVHDEREYGFFWYDWLWKILRPIVVFLCSLLIVVGMATVVWNKVNEKLLLPVDPASNQTQEFVIGNGDTISEIGKKLVDEGLLKNASVFKYIVQFKGLTDTISYGTYELSPAMDVNEIITALTSGSQTSERVITIIPGWTVEDVADYLVQEGAISSRDEFLSLCNQPEKFTRYSYALSAAYDAGVLSGRRYALEGYLAPDTYRVFKSADAESILKTLISQDNNVVDQVFYSDHSQYMVNSDGVYSQVEQYQSELTMDQVFILASMIEKEAGNTDDYARVLQSSEQRLEAGKRRDGELYHRQAHPVPFSERAGHRKRLQYLLCRRSAGGPHLQSFGQGHGGGPVSGHELHSGGVHVLLRDGAGFRGAGVRQDPGGTSGQRREVSSFLGGLRSIA